MAILLAVIERDGSSQIGGKVLQTIDDRARHILWSASREFFEQGEAQSALLEYHQRVGAFSADGGITFPVTILAAVGDVRRALIDTGSLGDQHPFLSRIFPFSPVFSPTLEMLRKITSGFEDKLVDRLIAHAFIRVVDRETTGDLFGAPPELEMLLYVLLDGQIVYPWSGPTQFASSRGSSVRPERLIPALLGAVCPNFARYDRHVPTKSSGNIPQRQTGPATNHDFFTFLVAQDSIRSR
jgi:hypothetical protein